MIPINSFAQMPGAIFLFWTFPDGQISVTTSQQAHEFTV
jgi:hypothetical protein